MKSMIVKRFVFVFLALMLTAVTPYMSLALDTPSSTSELTVRYDSGNGEVYAELPVNYVKIKGLNLADAVIVSGNGYSITDGQLGTVVKETGKRLFWTGKIKYGKSKRSVTKDAETAENKLPGAVLKFPLAAQTADGEDKDIILYLDEVTVNTGNSYNTAITGSTTVKVNLMSDSAFSAASPKTRYDRWDYDYTNYSTDAAVGQKIKATMKITEPAEGEIIGNVIDETKYPSMLVKFVDLDVSDRLIRSGASYTERYNGAFTEGIEMISGWASPIALAPIGEGIQNQSLVEKQIIGSNMKIKGKGSQYEALGIAAGGSENDPSSYYSGMVAAVKPQGFTFIWSGTVVGGKKSCSTLSTELGGQPTVEVKSRRTEGGTLSETPSANEWLSTTYLMNSAAEFMYKPDTGYAVKSIKVDGEPINLTDSEKKNGGSYIFTCLNKNPVTIREIRNGNVLDATESSHYEIEAEFEKIPEAKMMISKNVTGNLGDRDKEFSFTINFAGLPENYEGMLSQTIRNGDDENISFNADREGKAAITFKLRDEESAVIEALPVGAVFSVSEDSSDHRPAYRIMLPDGSERTAKGNIGAGISTSEVEITEGDTYTIEFENEKNIAPVTGTADDESMLINSLLTAGAIVLAASLALVLKKIYR